MTLLRWQQNIVDEEGNVLPSATVEIRDEVSGALVNLFEDIDGNTVKGNPLTVDSDGYGFAYMEPGRFKITATSADQSVTKSWRDVRLANDFSELGSRINQRVIYVGSVAELEARTPISGQQAILSGLRSGIFEFSSSNLSTEVSADPQQGEYIAPDDGAVPAGSNGAWARQSIEAITPEMFGAVGDGVADDTTAVKVWWEYSGYKKSADAEYLISGTDSFIAPATGDQFLVDLRGARFTVSEARGYLFRIDVTDSGTNVFVVGGTVSGQDNVARPLSVDTSNSSVAGLVWIRSFIAVDTFANTGLAYTSSAIGISVSLEASAVCIDLCNVNGVDRDYVDPGVVSSIGILVNEIIAPCWILNNRVRGVQSPVGDADADAISVFSRDRLLVGRQTVLVEVQGNRLQDAKGRFIKLQTTNAEVHGNRMFSTTGELITEFRAVDCQFGGCNVHDNYWNLFAGVTGGSNATFCYGSVNDAGNWENSQRVANNDLVIERDIRYFFHFVLNGGSQVIDIDNNNVKQNQSADRINNLCRLTCDDISLIDSVSISAKDNVYPADRDEVLVLVGADFSGDAATAGKVTVEIIDNKNTVAPASTQNVLVHVAETDTVPHLRKIVLRGNQTGGEHRLNAKSCNLNFMPTGNDFYFGTDGSTGGLVSAPTGYNRFVHVVTGGKQQSLGKDSNISIAKRNVDSADWYEYTGTLI